MSTVRDDDVEEALGWLCAGLPVNPLPPPRRRDETIAHAPVRVAALNAQQQKVFDDVSVSLSSISHVVTVMLMSRVCLSFSLADLTFTRYRLLLKLHLLHIA